MQLSLKEIVSVSLILFSIIDIIGSIPIIISLKKKIGHIESAKATWVSGTIMIGFLFVGKSILKLLGLDVESFAVAGAIVMAILAFEMILGLSIFKDDPNTSTGTIVPVAFPLIAGAGTLTTILSLRAVYQVPNILIGIILNLIFVYAMLKSSTWLEKKLGQGGFAIVRKVFGIILLAIAVKIFKTNI